MKHDGHGTESEDEMLVVMLVMMVMLMMVVMMVMIMMVVMMLIIMVVTALRFHLALSVIHVVIFFAFPTTAWERL